MSKLPIAALHPTGTSNFFEVQTRNLSTHRLQGTMMKNRTLPTIILADNNLPSPVSLCVDGVLLWLLLAWITAGTAAIITLLIKSCRNRWKHVDEEEFDWSNLDAIRSRSSRSDHTRSTSCSSAPSLRHIAVLPTPSKSVPPPSISSPSRFGHSHRTSSHLTSTRRAELVESNRRYKQRSRRLQSTTA